MIVHYLWILLDEIICFIMIISYSMRRVFLLEFLYHFWIVLRLHRIIISLYSKFYILESKGDINIIALDLHTITAWLSGTVKDLDLIYIKDNILYVFLYAFPFPCRKPIDELAKYFDTILSISYFVSKNCCFVNRIILISIWMILWFYDTEFLHHRNFN